MTNKDKTSNAKTDLNSSSEDTISVIIKFNYPPSFDMHSRLKSLGLSLSSEKNKWHGNINDLATLKSLLENIEHKMEIIE